MTIRRIFIGLAVTGIFMIGNGIVGFVPQAAAETLNYKYLSHAEKAEVFPIPDIEGHFVRFTLRGGTYIFENGEIAWLRQALYNNLVKGTGPIEVFTIINFQDGSTITSHVKAMVEANPAGVQTGAKSTGEIIHGTGRFQGIKGTVSGTSKVFPPQKGEPAGKTLGEGTFVYTLPNR